MKPVILKMRQPIKLRGVPLAKKNPKYAPLGYDPEKEGKTGSASRDTIETRQNKVRRS